MLKKLKSALATCVCGAIAFTSTAVGTFSTTAQAASTTTLNLVADNAYITSSILKSQDVTVHLKLYVEPTSTTEKFDTGEVVFNCDTSDIHLKNITTPTESASTATEYTYSFGTFSTKLTPFCFGTFSTNSKGKTGYSVPGSISQTNKFAFDSQFGSKLISDGQGGFYFNVQKYKDSESSTAYTKTFATNPDASCLSDKSNIEKIDLVLNDDGSAKFRFNFIDQQTFVEKTKESSLKYYDTTLSSGTTLPGNSDRFTWATTNSVPVLGEKDELPFVEVDAVLKKGTTVGDYTVSLSSSETYISNSSNKKYSASNGNLTISNATIHVVDSIVVSDYKTVEYFYTNEPGTLVKASDFLKSATASVSVNGNIQKVDITSGITCNRNYSSDLYKNGYDYTGVKVPLIYSNANLLDSNGEMICGEIKIGMKGDVNLDGKVNSSDAVCILKYYANYLVSGSSAKISTSSENENFVYFLADVNGESQDHGSTGGKVDSVDAVAILKYYAKSIIDKNVQWSDVL